MRYASFSLPQEKYTEENRMRAVEVFMCSILKKQGYGEGIHASFTLYNYTNTDYDTNYQILTIKDADVTTDECTWCQHIVMREIKRLAVDLTEGNTVGAVFNATKSKIVAWLKLYSLKLKFENFNTLIKANHAITIPMKLVFIA